MTDLASFTIFIPIAIPHNNMFLPLALLGGPLPPHSKLISLTTKEN